MASAIHSRKVSQVWIRELASPKIEVKAIYQQPLLGPAKQEPCALGTILLLSFEPTPSLYLFSWKKEVPFDLELIDKLF